MIWTSLQLCVQAYIKAEQVQHVMCFLLNSSSLNCTCLWTPMSITSSITSKLYFKPKLWLNRNPLLVVLFKAMHKLLYFYEDFLDTDRVLAVHFPKLSPVLLQFSHYQPCTTVQLRIRYRAVAPLVIPNLTLMSVHQYDLRRSSTWHIRL